MKKSKIIYIRSRKRGPEQKIENVTVRHIHSLLTQKYELLWIGGSVPIGAGIPDMVAAIFRPQLLKLARIKSLNIRLLSYLSMVPCAKYDTIVDHISMPQKQIEKQIKDCIGLGMILEKNGACKISKEWKNLFTEIITVEAKVSNWKRAANQAIRNKILSHYAYVALPMNVANRVKREKVFVANGLGILSIEEDNVNIIKKARKSNAIIWEYYYKLAYHIAHHYGGINGI